MDAQCPHTGSPVMTVAEAAQHVRRTPNALRILRHRRRGPKSFKAAGRLMYYVADLDAWLAESASADSRWNQSLDPTRVPAQARGTRIA